MDRGILQTDLEKTIESTVEKMGYSLVSVRNTGMRGTLVVAIIIFHKDGITIDTCAKVSRALYPKIEMTSGYKDVRLEVSSPGIDRKLKSIREFKIFTGKGVKILRDDKEWIAGIIESADDNGLCLKVGEEMQEISYDTVLKAKLDFTQEGREG